MRQKLRFVTIALVLVLTRGVSNAQSLLVSGGGSNTFTLTYPANLGGSVPQGMMFTFQSNQAVTGVATLNINGTGARTIKKQLTTDLVTNDILTGSFVTVIYDGTYWQMLSVSAVPSGSGTVTNVLGTLPISVATGTSTPVISISAATSVINGYLTSADWSTFNGKIGSGTSASGDLSGTYGTPTVSKIQNRTINNTAPAAGQALVWNNGSSWWEPQTISASGAAGGDLSGTYPNPTVANSAITTVKIANAAVDLTTKVTGILPPANGGTGISSFINGPVLFGGAIGNISQTNNLFWDNTNIRLGVGINTPASSVDIRGSGSTSATSTFNAVNSSSTPMLFLRDDANIGMGTNAPTATLDIVGGIRVRNLSSAGTNLVQVDLNGSFSLASSASNYVFGSGGVSRLPYYTNSTTLLTSSTFLFDGSSIAIGGATLNGNLPFQVQAVAANPGISGTSSIASGTAIAGSSSNVAAGSIGVTGSSSGAGTGVNATNGGSGYALYALNAGTGYAGYFQQSGTGYAAAFMGGSVGIGTATPQNTLDVVGGASIRNLSSPGNNLVQTDASGNLFINTIAGFLKNFKDNLYTTSVNNTVYAAQLQVVGATTDMDVIIGPKGNGSILASVPDGTSTGGNKRGGYGAIDFQIARTSATQVASGFSAIIIGGSYNTASGSLAFVGSGNSNIVAGGTSAIVSGTSNIVTSGASNSFIGAGQNNTITGINAIIGAGIYNLVSGSGSGVGSGYGNLVSGDYSAVGGGFENVARSYAEFAVGTYNLDYTPSSASNFQPGDRIFVVGNGASSSSRSNAFTILKNGNVGIGASVPGRNLHIANTTVSPNIGMQYQATAATSGTNLGGFDFFDGQTSTAQASILVQRDAASSNATDVPTAIIFNTVLDGTVAPAEKMRINNGGNVGIGTTTPVVNARLAIKDGHLQVQQTVAPGIAAGAGAGTGPTVSLANATDVAGVINVTAGTSPAIGILCTITFNKAYTVAPIVMLTPTNTATANAMSNKSIYVTSTTTTFLVNFGVAATASTAYLFNYIIIETQ